jgi:sensor histidine kinase regulating citrate/malate metabolism
MTFITKRIKDPSVGGLLLGKMGRCRELGISLELDETSYIASTGNIDSNSLVTIIGNLLENSMLSVIQCGKGKKLIKCSIFDQSDKILISVYDEGCGIRSENLDRIFEKGFSTRKDSGGYGLYKVREIVALYGGEIDVMSEEGKYAEFMVSLPSEGSNG